MKTYQKITISLITSIALGVGFVGCGSSSDDSSTGGAEDSATVGTAYYVDSAVAGVNYVCGDRSGTTDNEGMFQFTVGASDTTCSFKLGNILLRTLESDQLVDNAKIVENNVTVARFLQTIDLDGDPANGIQITPEIAEVIATTLADTVTVPEDDDVLEDVVTSLKNDIPDYTGEVVTVEEAQEHLATTQANVTKEMLAGKTFYVVHVNNDELSLGKATFNATVTEETWVGLINDNESETDTITLDGNKLVWGDGSYTQIEGTYSNYILALDYNADNSSDGKSFIFTTETEARNYYQTLFQTQTASNSVWAINDGDEFQYLTLLNDGTFIYAEYDSESQEPENGVEVGTYTLASDLSSITFNVIYDGNYNEDDENDISGVGNKGTPKTYPISVSEDGTKLTVTINDDEGESTIVFNNITDQVDMWKSTNTNMSTPLFSFLELDTTTGKFLYTEYDSQYAEPENGLEEGTYSISSDESQITFNVQYDGNYVADANGDYNATDVSGVGSIGTAATYPISLSTDGDALTVTINSNETITFTKLF